MSAIIKMKSDSEIRKEWNALLNKTKTEQILFEMILDTRKMIFAIFTNIEGTK